MRAAKSREPKPAALYRRLYSFMNSSSPETVYKGIIAHTPTMGALDIFAGAIAVADGAISYVARSEADLAKYVQLKNITNDNIIDYKDKLIIPGFVDTHCHAPQYVFAGTGNNTPLLEWLDKYTFKFESKCKDLEFAKNVYEKVVSRLLKNGTTTVTYFATIHTEASKLLCDICHTKGQRAFVGKVCMNQNSPDFYIESHEQAVQGTLDVMHHCQSLPDNQDKRVQAIVTPRFAPTCTDQLLKDLGSLAKEHDLNIQSHVSENKGEIEWVKALFPENQNYSDVYYTRGLLTEKTIMAHAVHLTDDEVALFQKSKASIAHCPTSNYTLISGIMSVRKALKSGIKVGLGTDVSGGYSPSMLQTIRHTLTMSVAAKELGLDADSVLDHKEAFYLATQGGADALCLGDKVGSFEVGKQFDALIIDSTTGNYDTFDWEEPQHRFEKFIYLGDDRNITNVFVNGKLLKL